MLAVVWGLSERAVLPRFEKRSAPFVSYNAGNHVTRRADDEQRWSDYMAAAHRGDARAYERLLSELGSVIEGYLRSRFGPLLIVEDCVQECLLSIHRARHTYDSTRPFRPWLFAIVRNRTIDMLRRSAVGERSDQELFDSELAGVDPGPEAGLVGGEILEALKPELRDALTLTKIFGYTIREAAEYRGISETAMKSRVSRAIRATASLLDSERNER
jgi:RNA polymerase sigma-70 factor (ECF subfamily)